MGLFSRNKKEPAPAKPAPKPTTAAAPAAVPKPAPVKPNETALLKEDLERKIKALDKKTDSLTVQINKEIVKAKEYLTAGDKRRAAECMRRKNNWEKQRDNNMAKIRKYEDQVRGKAFARSRLRISSFTDSCRKERRPKISCSSLFWMPGQLDG